MENDRRADRAIADSDGEKIAGIVGAEDIAGVLVEGELREAAGDGYRPELLEERIADAAGDLEVGDRTADAEESGPLLADGEGADVAADHAVPRGIVGHV